MNRIVLTALADCIDDPVKINELFKIQLNNNINLRKSRMELEEDTEDQWFENCKPLEDSIRKSYEQQRDSVLDESQKKNKEWEKKYKKLEKENKKLKEQLKACKESTPHNPCRLLHQHECLASNEEIMKLKEDNKLQAEMISLLEGDEKLALRCHTCGTWRVDFEDITNHNGNKISLCQDCLDDGDFKECLHCLQYFHSDMISTNHCVWLRGCMACIKKYG